LEKGSVVLHGESGRLKNDPKIRESYLGIS
jgi:ABC-type uncharacterized transport system ATPase subunit